MKIRFGFANGASPKPESVTVRKEYRSQPAAPKRETPLAASAAYRVPQTSDNLQEIKRLVGLDTVKGQIEEIVAYAKIERRRQQEGLAVEPMVLHMAFKGNPGTGKTTVARLLGKTFKDLGLLEKGHLVEVERADLVGEYVGHTAQKAREQIRRSIGGVLFIDEAYSLARGGGKDFGREAIDALVKSMEDHRKELILILAGYKQEMETFLESNPGLRSRIPIHLDFPDFSVSELVEIGKMMVEERQYRLAPEAESKLEAVVRQAALYGHRFDGNARLVRNLVEKAIRRQAMRLVKKRNMSREELILLEACDIPAETYKIERNDNVMSLAPWRP